MAGSTWLRIAKYLLDPPGYKDMIIAAENSLLDEDAKTPSKDSCKLKLVYINLDLKSYNAVDSERIDDTIEVSQETKVMIKTMIQSSIDQTDGTGILYNKESASHLEPSLQHEVETTSIKLDEVVMEFVNKFLILGS